MSDDPALPAVTVAVTPAPLPESFTTAHAAALARDIAIEMYEEATVLKKHGITAGQYETLKTLPYFRSLVERMAIEWNSPASSQQRLAIQTAVGLEEVLPSVIARAKISNEPLQGVAQLVKVLADIAGANSNARQSTAPTEKFSITINLGADTEVYDKSRPVQATIDADPERGNTVETIRTGLSSLLAIQTQPEKA